MKKIIVAAAMLLMLAGTAEARFKSAPTAEPVSVSEWSDSSLQVARADSSVVERVTQSLATVGRHIRQKAVRRGKWVLFAFGWGVCNVGCDLLKEWLTPQTTLARSYAAEDDCTEAKQYILEEMRVRPADVVLLCMELLEPED